MLLFVLKILSFLCVLAGVAFYTLVERKMISYAQIRVGPNKVSIAGIFQPFSDALKLLSKDMFFPTSSNWSVFKLSPSISLMLALMAYLLIIDYQFMGIIQPLVLWFLLILSLGVFPSTLAGWSSNSSYARVGGYRSLSQTISYEVALFLSLFIPLSMYKSLSLNSVNYATSAFLSILVLLFLIVILAETNRAPFDLSEGESELVSGFNIEYGGSGFTLFFLAEYAMMLILSLMMSLLYFANIFWGFMFMFMLLVIRASYPRLRYDTLMKFMWSQYLPLVTFVCAFVIILM